MDKAQKAAKELLDSISREELIELLTESGLHVKEGTGEVIYRDEHIPFKKKINVKANVTGYSQYRHEDKE